MAFQDFIIGGVWGFFMCFARIGAAIMIMPGLGDSFTPVQLRLLFALAFTLIVTPLVASMLPPIPPSAAAIVLLLAKEVGIGLFFGTIGRILIATLDTAGMVVSTQSSLANAQIFNPQFSTQGSLVGAMFSLLGLVLLFALDLHLVLLDGIIKSYDVFPAKDWYFPAQDFADVTAAFVSKSFRVAVELTLPYIIVVFMLYVAMGVLARLMPQLQIFIFAIPIQVTLSLLIVIGTLHIFMSAWAQFFTDGIASVVGGGGNGG